MRYVPRRAVRTAAIVTGTIALAIPATTAFASSEPSPSPSATNEPSAKPKWGEVFEVTLGNGAKAKVQDRGGKFVAIISVKGKEIATLSATHPTVTHDGVKYDLSPDNGHIGITYLNGKKDEKKDEKRDQKKDHKQDQKQGHNGQQKNDKAAPKGGVKAGAEGVDQSQGNSGSHPALLAAGGGMAAAGAGGLGFAMLRRRRDEGN
ncbi:hypothetical protein [Streptomyces sp. NBC_01304]|uniref:hypothetical protein n=1 Tax=Streptomyces sp. NBC_01304 TaxID=2903818 RepID=UPI002E13CD8C|nr:hypothetical protein OG430_19835 [Streptomyces sp. NBC_01304]